MSDEIIYLDYNATTPCDQRVIDYMLPWFGQNFGNASSRQHAYGWKAAEIVKYSREKIASSIECEPDEIIFTSGATESINLALKGILEVYQSKGKHIITAATEHAAVRDTCNSLALKGIAVTFLKPGVTGVIDPADLEKAIRPDTILIALMWANNETGVIQPVQRYSEIAANHGVLFFSDATQAVGKIPVSVKNTGIGAMAFSSHKVYGPKGAGALYVRRKNPRVKLAPLIEGGGQEKNLRSGTLNVPGIVGFGEAIKLCQENLSTEMEQIKMLRDSFENEVLLNDEVFINGNSTDRLPGVSNLCFRFTDGRHFLAGLNQKLAVSSGSACSSASGEPSPVLIAMGLGQSSAYSSVRFSIGRFTTVSQTQSAIQVVNDVLKSIRDTAYPSFKELVDTGGKDVAWAHPQAGSADDPLTGL